MLRHHSRDRRPAKNSTVDISSKNVSATLPTNDMRQTGQPCTNETDRLSDSTTKDGLLLESHQHQAQTATAHHVRAPVTADATADAQVLESSEDYSSMSRLDNVWFTLPCTDGLVTPTHMSPPFEYVQASELLEPVAQQFPTPARQKTASPAVTHIGPSVLPCSYPSFDSLLLFDFATSPASSNTDQYADPACNIDDDISHEASKDMPFDSPSVANQGNQEHNQECIQRGNQEDWQNDGIIDRHLDASDRDDAVIHADKAVHETATGDSDDAGTTKSADHGLISLINTDEGAVRTLIVDDRPQRTLHLSTSSEPVDEIYHDEATALAIEQANPRGHLSIPASSSDVPGYGVT